MNTTPFATGRRLTLRQPALLAPLLLLLTVLPPAGIASPFYDLHVLAKTGDPAPGMGYTFNSFKPNPSINKDGQVAFIGVLQNGLGAVAGEGVFLSDGMPVSLEWGSTGDALGANKTIGSVGINHAGVVAFQCRMSRAPSPAGVRGYSQATGAWVGETIAKATTARPAITIDPCLGRILPPYSCPQTVCPRLAAFDDLLPDVSLNDDGLMAFTGLGGDDSGGSRCGLDKTEENVFQAGKTMSATNPPSPSA